MGRVISTCIQFIDQFTKPSQETLKAMRKMSSEAKATGKSIKSAGDTIANAGSAMTKSVTAPIAGVGIAAVKTAADYESAMSNVQAITGATGDDFKKLTQLGKDLGASTAWSAQECAEAMQYTGMAGWTAKENIDGLKGIGIVIKVVMAVVKTEITTAFRIAANVIESAARSIKQVISGITKVFNGILDFISGVFTGNWKKAWEGVKNIFGGALQALAGLCKVPINAVIGIINSAIEGINSISVDIPDGIPLVGGKHIGFSIPKIPALAKGTPNWLGGLAQINEKGGEIVDLPKGTRVYPHDESVSIAKNTSNAKLSMLDRRLAKMEAGKGKSDGKKEVNITIPKLADQIIVKDKTDIDEIADKIATNLKNTALNMGVC